MLAVLEQVFDQFVFQFFDAAARFDLRYGGRLVFRAPADDFLVADKFFGFAAGRVFDAAQRDLAQQDLFVDLHLPRAFARVDRTGDGVRNDRNALHDVGNQRRLAQRVARRLGQ